MQNKTWGGMRKSDSAVLWIFSESVCRQIGAQQRQARRAGSILGPSMRARRRLPLRWLGLGGREVDRA